MTDVPLADPTSLASRFPHDDVTSYLLSPSLCAFQGRSPQLLLLSFHRLMASSTAALAKSLERVADRLRRMRSGVRTREVAEAATALLDDLEDDELEAVEADEDEPTAIPAALEEELARVEDFVRRAHALPHDSKAQSLVLAPFAVDQAADLCSCGHENDDSAAGLVCMSWTAPGTRTTATWNA